MAKSTAEKSSAKNSQARKTKNEAAAKKRKSSQSRRVKQMRFSVLPDEQERIEIMAKPFGSVSNFARLKMGLVDIFEADLARRKKGYSRTLSRSTERFFERRENIASTLR